MVMKKKIQSEVPIVIGGGDQKDMFRPGFRYMIGTSIYTVIEATQSDNTEMRKMINDSGDVEFLTVESILNDFRPAKHGASTAVPVKPDERYMEKTPEEKEEEKE